MVDRPVKIFIGVSCGIIPVVEMLVKDRQLWCVDHMSKRSCVGTKWPERLVIHCILFASGVGRTRFTAFGIHIVCDMSRAILKAKQNDDNNSGQTNKQNKGWFINQPG